MPLPAATTSTDARSGGVNPARIAEALRANGPVHDAEFDELFPVDLRGAATTYFTPVAVARRAAALLVEAGARRVLDVGAGVGKFCLDGACAASVEFVGIEQRARLVEVAREAARQLGVGRVEFRQGKFESVNPALFDGFYLFNPFAENLFRVEHRLDDSVELTETRYLEDVRRARALLDGAPPEAAAVTYCGFGGQMPRGYRLWASEPHGAGILRLWVRGRAAPRDDALVLGNGARCD
jgi:hypothetical protein